LDQAGDYGAGYSGISREAEDETRADRCVDAHLAALALGSPDKPDKDKDKDKKKDKHDQTHETYVINGFNTDERGRAGLPRPTAAESARPGWPRRTMAARRLTSQEALRRGHPPVQTGSSRSRGGRDPHRTPKATNTGSWTETS
jgi:hypothetical protein